jgi:hypothetical protein
VLLILLSCLQLARYCAKRNVFFSLGVHPAVQLNRRCRGVCGPAILVACVNRDTYGNVILFIVMQGKQAVSTHLLLVLLRLRFLFHGHVCTCLSLLINPQIFLILTRVLQPQWIHFTTQINQPTRCNSFTSLLLEVLCRSTCFGHLQAHHQELTTALTASGFTLERGGSSVVSRGLAFSLFPVNGCSTSCRNVVPCVCIRLHESRPRRLSY